MKISGVLRSTAASLDDAVSFAADLARPGDVVLLDRPVEAALDLLVEGRPKLKGRLHRSGRRLVFRVGSGSEVVPEKQDPDA